MGIKIVISIILLSLPLLSCNKGEKEIVIVPDNYIGYIIIIYDQKGGAKQKYEGKKRVYEIPKNGILKTQFSANYGLVGFTEFYYKSIGPENRIPFLVEPKKIPRDSVVAYGGISGNANRDLAGKETVSYILYFIGNSTQIDTAYDKAEKLNIVELADKP